MFAATVGGGAMTLVFHPVKQDKQAVVSASVAPGKDGHRDVTQAGR